MRGQGLLCSGFTVHGSPGGCPGPGALAGLVPVKAGAVRKRCPRLPDFSAPAPRGGPLTRVRSVLAFLGGRGCLRCRLFSAPRGLCSSVAAESSGAVRVLGRRLTTTDPAPGPLLLQWGVDPGACLIYSESQKVRDLRALGRAYLDSVWFVLSAAPRQEHTLTCLLDGTVAPRSLAHPFCLAPFTSVFVIPSASEWLLDRLGPGRHLCRGLLTNPNSRPPNKTCKAAVLLWGQYARRSLLFSSTLVYLLVVKVFRKSSQVKHL